MTEFEALLILAQFSIVNGALELILEPVLLLGSNWNECLGIRQIAQVQMFLSKIELRRILVLYMTFCLKTTMVLLRDLLNIIGEVGVLEVVISQAILLHHVVFG